MLNHQPFHANAQLAAPPCDRQEYIDYLLPTLQSYLSPEAVAQVDSAYFFAKQAHASQQRSSGEPYITHPVAVMGICAQWRMDASALMAALLHDVIEDQDVSKADIAEHFGPEVAELVDGLTKLERIHFESKAQQQAESFRKMLLATAKDIRVIIIKLADRLHNMRTLGAVSMEKALRVSAETLDIYAPIAHRLGLHKVVSEFEDITLQITYPKRMQVLERALLAAQKQRAPGHQKLFQQLEKAFNEQGLTAQFSASDSNLYTIHRRMKERRQRFQAVMGTQRFRITVPKPSDCYVAMGILHQLFPPMPGKFKDYIAIPKTNGYQSLHTMVLGPGGARLRFHIRTDMMDRVAQYGVATQWMYQTEGLTHDDLQRYTRKWIQPLLDIQAQNEDANDFIDNVKINLFPDAVYALTPKGRIIALPRSATPIDFAYAIHTDVGNQAISARINNEPRALQTPLNNGDIVEIITDPNATPHFKWLSHVRTGKARSEIRQYLKTVKREQSRQFGQQLLHQAMDALNIAIPPDSDPIWANIAKSSDVSHIDDIFIQIGLGHRLASVVARRFLMDSPLLHTTANSLVEEEDVPISIRGTEGQSVTLSTCCTPIPGDKLMGIVKTGYGLIVHRDDCQTAQAQRQENPKRWVSVNWDPDHSKLLSTRLRIIIQQTKGVLGRIAVQIAAQDSNILDLRLSDDASDIGQIDLTLQVQDRDHLAKIMHTIRQMPEIRSITRVQDKPKAGT